MSRTYWIARALRSFGYAGLIVFGWVVVVTFLNASAEPPQGAPDECCCYCAPNGPATISGILFFYLLGVSFAAFWIHSLNFLDCLDFARSFGTSAPPEPLNKTIRLPRPASKKSLFSDFLSEFPPLTPGQWRERAILPVFVPIFLSPVLFPISLIFIQKFQNDFSSFSKLTNAPEFSLDALIIDGILWILFGMLLLAGLVLYVGHVVQCFSLARIAGSTARSSTGTGMETRA